MPVLTSAALPAQTAGGGDSTTLVGVFEATDASGVSVSRVEIEPPPGYSTVTGIATNNATFTVRQVRAGASVATIGTLTLGVGTNLVAETPVNVPITTTVTFQPDDAVDVVMHQNGTGIAIGAGLVVVVDIS